MADRTHGIVATMTLSAEPTSAGEARRFVADVLREIVRPVDIEVLALLTSELVTNAVLHARTSVDLVVRRIRGRIQIEASDTGQQIPLVPDAGRDPERGRGTTIVAALAEEWGVIPTAGGKTVWFRYHPA